MTRPKVSINYIDYHSHDGFTIHGDINDIIEFKTRYIGYTLTEAKERFRKEARNFFKRVTQ
tara:strand:- start:242 stop:424 length:183 start_codon:yes stop_codon:yes gene_type:complete